MREVETLKEAGSRGAGLRILIGRRTGSAYTSDLSPEGIAPPGAIRHRTGRDHHRRPARRPARARRTRRASRRPAASTAATSPNSKPAVKIDTARRAEAAALAADPRIVNSEGASFDSHLGRHVFANSLGFAGEYRTSYCSLSMVPVAREGESMERDYWFSLARGFAGLEAARRGRPHRRRARAAPPGRRQGGHAEGARGLRAAHRALAAGQHLRGRPRHLHLPPGVLPGRQARRKGRLRKAHRDRRRHHPRPVRHLALRRRRRALAPHRGDRKRRAQAATCSTPTPPASWG